MRRAGYAPIGRTFCLASLSSACRFRLTRTNDCDILCNISTQISSQTSAHPFFFHSIKHCVFVCFVRCSLRVCVLESSYYSQRSDSTRGTSSTCRATKCPSGPIAFTVIISMAGCFLARHTISYISRSLIHALLLSRVKAFWVT